MSKEFKAIARIIQTGTKTVQRNGVWSGIYQETGCGKIAGRTLTFTDSDLDTLRRYAKSLTGLDPLFDSTAGSRIDLARKTSDEKLAQDSVFGQLIVTATLGNATVPVGHQEVAVPAGSVLSVPMDQLQASALSQRPILIIENGAIMPQCQRLKLPPPWKNAVAIYRGHRENARHVRGIIEAQPATNLGLFYDFDPEGLAMALSFGKGHVLIPNLSGTSVPHQREAFRRQGAAMKRLASTTEDPTWGLITQTMKEQEQAVMQEHMIAHGVALIAQNAVCEVHCSDS